MANRVSIRAVLAHEGDDVTAMLARAGIVDPVAIPVLAGDAGGSPPGRLGDGITPNLTGVLELHEAEDAGAAPDTEANSRRVEPPQPQTEILPARHGMQPLAPVRRRTS